MGPVMAAEEASGPKPSEYKRSDQNFYPRGDILRMQEGAAIVAKGNYTQTGDSYFFTPKDKAPKEIFVEIDNDWIEPITPPDMPASLDIAPDAMQIREPQGDVTVALPNAPGNFGPVTDGMGLPNGSVIKTGPNATTAILFGGVDSARLIPGSEAAVQQTVTADTRAVEVDLTVGAVFSKVGKQIGVKSDYKVHTRSGDALAHGTDFVTLIAQDHTDVWVAQGTVELVPPDARKGEAVTSDGTGPLKLLRSPTITEAKLSLAADSDALTAILNFIPMANQKVASLRADIARGGQLTETQQAYLNRIKQVPAFIKLALVEPPPPPPPPPAPPKPETISVHTDGTIKFLGATTDLAGFQARLKTLIAANPSQSLILKANPKTPYDKYQAVVQSLTDAGAVAPTLPTDAPQPPPPPPPPVPVIGLDAVGTIFVDGAATTQDVLKSKLTDTASANPGAEFTLVKRKKVTAEQWQKLVTIFHDAKLKVHVLNEEEYHGTTVPFPAGPAAEPPQPAPLPVTGIDAMGTIFVDGAPTTPDDFKSKVADFAKANPTMEFTLVKRKKVTTEQWQNLVTIFHDAKLRVHVLDEKEYHGKTTPFPPGPAAEPPPPPPLPIVGIDAVGTLFVDGVATTPEDLKTRVDAIAKANPQAQLTLVKRKNVTKEQWQGVVTMIHDAKLKVSLLDEKEFQGAIAAFPPGPAAEPPPPVPEPVFAIDATGSTFIDANPATEDMLKSKFDEVARTNPPQPLILVKKTKVTHEQWQKIVDLAHAANLKLSVVNAREYQGVAPFPPEPPVPPPTAETPPASTTSASPPSSVDQAPPAVIGLDTDGSMTWDGSPATEDDLKAKLSDLARTEPKEPLLLLKSGQVKHDQWQKIVAMVHDAKLKIWVKTAPLGNSETAPAPAKSQEASEVPTPHLSAAPSPQKLIPVEINLKSDGSMLLDGNPVILDDLQAKLADLAQVNAQQPVLLIKTEKADHDQVIKIITACHDAKLKVHVRTMKTFTPPAPSPSPRPPEVPSSPAPNLPAPTVSMHPAIPPASEDVMPANNGPPPATP